MGANRTATRVRMGADDVAAVGARRSSISVGRSGAKQSGAKDGERYREKDGDIVDAGASEDWEQVDAVTSARM